MNRPCVCDARFSGSDDAEWRARGAPSCTCYDMDWDKWNEEFALLYAPNSFEASRINLRRAIDEFVLSLKNLLRAS